jgi:ribosomal protein S27AE
MTTMTCPRCGAGVEVWTSGEATTCGECSYALFKRQRRAH